MWRLNVEPEDAAMNLSFTPEHDELRSVVRSFLTAQSDEAEVRRLMTSEQGYDPDVWKQMADQLGLQAMAVPEEHGGAGFGARELGIVFEEAGRALLCAPLLASAVLATEALLASGDTDAATELLPALAAGEEIGTLALLEPGSRFDVTAVSTSATRSGDGWSLHGRKAFVLDGHLADVIIVPAATPAGVSLFAVRSGSPGMTSIPVPTLDQTRRLATVVLDGARGRLVGAEGAGLTVLRDVLDVAGAMLASEQVGGAAAALDMAVEYAGVRRQFGRAIGQFQAVKHKCANMLVALESARSAAYYACWAAAEAPDELPTAVCVAQAHCSQSYYRIAADNIQIHGGIGFTWEHPAHLYFKRASSSQVLLGPVDAHRDRLADLLGI